MTPRDLPLGAPEGNPFPTVAVGAIGADTVQCVSARDLHSFLGAGKDFTTWIKERISQYGFEQGRDYEAFDGLSSPVSGSAKARPQATKEYAITLDMAKELSMVERTEKGKQARLYFLECERRAKASSGGGITAEDLINNPHQLLAIAQGYALQIEDLKRDMTVMQRDVDALDRIAGSDDLFGLRVTAKLVNMPERKFTDWLQINRWAYRMNGTRHLLCFADKHRAGLCRNVATSYDKVDGTTGVRDTLKFTMAGVIRIAKAFNITLTEAEVLAAECS